MATVKRRKFWHVSCSYKIILAGSSGFVMVRSVGLGLARRVPFSYGKAWQAGVGRALYGELCSGRVRQGVFWQAGCVMARSVEVGLGRQG